MLLTRDAYSYIIHTLEYNVFHRKKVIDLNKEKKCMHFSIWKRIVFLPGNNSGLIDNIWNL